MFIKLSSIDYTLNVKPSKIWIIKHNYYVKPPFIMGLFLYWTHLQFLLCSVSHEQIFQYIVFIVYMPIPYPFVLKSLHPNVTKLFYSYTCHGIRRILHIECCPCCIISCKLNVIIYFTPTSQAKRRACCRSDQPL